MKTNELVFLENLVRFELREKEKDSEPDRTYYYKTVDSIHVERRRFMQQLSSTIPGGDDGDFESRVRSYQEKLVGLIEEVSEQLTKDDLLNCSGALTEENTWLNLYRLLYSELTDILWLIENDYTRYFDVHVRAPIFYIMSARQRISREIPVLFKTFSNKGVREQLMQLVMAPFNEFLTNDEGEIITYHKLFYQKIFMQEMAGIAVLPPENFPTVVEERLRELNYNSNDYFKYCTSRITEDLKEYPQREQLERLMFLRKEFAQLEHRRGLSYQSSYPPLNERLLLWAREEVTYYRELYELSHNKQPITDDILRWRDFKVYTQFSVAQIAYVLKLLFETGMYTNQNQTELLEFFAYFFTSQKQMNISIKSLRKNYYSQDAAVAEAVRTILISLMNRSKMA